MKTTSKAAAAGLMSLAAMLSVPLSAAEAGWRDYAKKHGAGFYVETYADKYVTEDNRYKGSKHDTHSGKYYDTKTGKWTGKSYDGEHGGKTASKSTKSAKSTKTDTAYVKPAKTVTKTATVKSAAKTTSTVAATTAKKPAKVVAQSAKVVEPEGETKAEFGAQAYEGAEVYGPPMPKELETAEVHE